MSNAGFGQGDQYTQDPNQQNEEYGLNQYGQRGNQQDESGLRGAQQEQYAQDEYGQQGNEYGTGGYDEEMDQGMVHGRAREPRPEPEGGVMGTGESEEYEGITGDVMGTGEGEQYGRQSGIMGTGETDEYGNPIQTDEIGGGRLGAERPRDTSLDQ